MAKFKTEDEIACLVGLKYTIGSPDDDGCTIVLSELRLTAGDCIAVVGPSGSGKSTLLDILALARNPRLNCNTFSFREIGTADIIDLIDAWRQQSSDLRRLRASFVSYSPQRGGYLPCLSVANNILLRSKLNGGSTPDLDLMEQVLASVDLTAGKLKRRLDSLSAGERQRAILAQSLCLQAALTIADEPTSALHPVQAKLVLEALSANARKLGSVLVIATHDVALAAQLNFKIYEGKTVKMGKQNFTHFKVAS